ncbi:CTP synthetase [Maritimibacter sp. DP1N21-5]|uniref:CTP synthetase n=1 Tax=Maritimibacter sp. DP1N21-5 TaxID=2836867 RepID=UPI001C492663|nr:CTP synthetase [Maritimibacter sp. DP1N21-5]MBV7408030.1 CTP synthetase [Maritimibacter sp. DP1N21-5]
MFLIIALYAMGGTTLAGVFMVAALTAGYTTQEPIIWSALAGFIVALPLVWLVNRRLRG